MDFKGLNSAVLSVQTLNDALRPASVILEMQREMDAKRLPILNAYKQIDVLKDFKLDLDRKLFNWKNPDIGVLKEDFFSREQAFQDRFKSSLPTRELFPGITLSAASRDVFNLSIPQVLRQAYELPIAAHSIGNLYDKSDAIYSSLKASRVITEHLKFNQNFYKVDYDFSKVIEKGDAEESKIITRSLLITEAKTIKKVIFEIYRNNSNLFKIKPRQFEELIAELLMKKGYNVELTKQTRDGGFDIIALSFDNGMPLKYLVECKKYGSKRPVGIDIVRSFCDVIQTEHANKGIIFTTSSFTSEVRKRQRANPFILELNDHSDIIQWVQSYIMSF